MAAITRQEQNAANRWYTWISIDAQNALMFITPAQLTEAEALDIQTRHIAAHALDGVPHAVIDIYEYKDTLKAAMTYIKKQNPTLAKWNTYLGTLAWHEAYMVRFVLATLALKLAERAEITLSDFTETQMLTQMKAFIIATPAARLAKIVFGEQP